MFYYSCYSCRGRAALAVDLNVNDPFALSPAEIVERILKAGYLPAVELPRPDPWPQVGTLTEVRRDGLTFLLAVSAEEEMIGLQVAGYSNDEREE